jgi:soluble lytic murein transglycosylase-like protein
MPGLEAPSDRVALPSRPAARLRTWTLAIVVALATLHGAAEAQYLAVFVDGRMLKVSGVRLVAPDRIRLDLDDGHLEVPLARLERVIADEQEPAPAAIPAPACRPDYSHDTLAPRTPYASEIRSASKESGLNPALVAAVVAEESGFRPWAVSRVGAVGLMQLMPSVWLRQGIKDPYEPRGNLRAGCRHLRELLGVFGDLPRTLAAYNAGRAVVEKSGGVPPYRETRAYVRRVLARFCPAGTGTGS